MCTISLLKALQKLLCYKLQLAITDCIFTVRHDYKVKIQFADCKTHVKEKLFVSIKADLL